MYGIYYDIGPSIICCGGGGGGILNLSTPGMKIMLGRLWFFARIDKHYTLFPLQIRVDL